MAVIGEDVATHVAQTVADKAMQELHYLCCYKSYVDDYEGELPTLRARRDTVLQDIEEAKHRNENQIEPEVQLWLDEGDGLIEEDTKRKEKWFGMITNCFWQYKRGKELERNTLRITRLIDKSKNFNRVARSTGLPGIGFFSSPDFMHFEGRKLTSEKLKEALKDDNKFMIGLYGLGGTGKTTMAIEVGKDVYESKAFDKVILSVVSKNSNLRKIQHDIAKDLDFSFEEGIDELEQAKAKQLWKRIAEGGEKILIILDDVWDKLTLQDIGIPLGCHGKGCCSILLTTRHWTVCGDMRCHEAIELKVLNEKDAVDLLLSYADISIDGSTNEFKGAALGVVKECGRLPVAIVAVASALKSRPPTEWDQALKRLRSYKPIHGINEDLKDAYNSLTLSYDNLKNGKAKQLLLLCSLFPEDCEIPIELLTRIAIGLGLCGDANNYSVARSHFTLIKNELLDSCLLLKAENESVKMHDLVREVVQWIGNKQVQVATDANATSMENIQYSSWNIVDFPNHFDGRKLEVLLLWINKTYPPIVKVPDAIFEGMEKLKILALMSPSKVQISATSLFHPHLTLINVHTLAIKEIELGDISILVNLKSLQCLGLRKCSIIELPNEIRELQKLRLLEMVKCSITGRNNPFEVIGSCLQLEELYYVSNDVAGLAQESKALQITQFPQLQMYHIKGNSIIQDSAWDFLVFLPEDHETIGKYNLDFSASRYFVSHGLKVNFSDEIFESLMERIEVLELDGDYNNRGWTNIVPNILFMGDDGSKKDHLSRLCLESMNKIKCLIDTEHLRSGVAIFSKLVELELYSMDVRKLCCGPYPVDFLKKLKKLHLSSCGKLEGTLFDGKLELYNLQSICINKCSMTCLFHPSTAQSLKQLDRLEVTECSELKYILVEKMDYDDPNQKGHDSMFSTLTHLELQGCPELEYVLPICFCEDLSLLESMKIHDCENLKYIFGQHPMGKYLHHIGKEAILELLRSVEISRLPNFVNVYAECFLTRPCSEEVQKQKSSPSTKVEDGSSSLSRGPLCCFWPKSNASTTHRHPSASMTPQLNHNQASNVNYVVNRAHGLFTLYPYRSLRSMEIGGLGGLKSLFTLSIASSFKLLETLQVRNCNTLQHIVTYEEQVHDHMNVHSTSRSLQKLRLLLVSDCEELLSIIKEDEENQQNRLDPQYQACFPMLSKIQVKHCKKLKCLFSIFTCGKLSRLSMLEIEDAPELSQVFERKQDASQGLVIKDVFPDLLGIRLANLPSLHTIYPGIDFQSVKLCIVRRCYNIPLATNCNHYELLEYARSLWQEKMNFVDNDDYCNVKATIFNWAYEMQNKEVEEAFERDRTISEQNSSTPNLAHSEDASKEGVEKVSTIQKQKSSSPNLTKIEERGIIQEDIENDSTMSQKSHGSPNFGKNSVTSRNEIAQEQLSTSRSNRDNLDRKARLSTHSEITTSNLGTSASTDESCEKESKGDQEAFEKAISLKEPTNDLFTKETSKKAGFAIPPSTSTVKSSPLVEIMVNHETPNDVGEIRFEQKFQAFEEHDLMRLFQIMKEDGDMEADVMPNLSKIIADLQHDKVVSKAFADLEGLLKMSLSEIACSEESKLRLENALNILSSHCSEDGPPSHGLQATIHSLQEEIQTLLSSFNQASATIDTFTKLEQKDKLMIEQRSKREKDVKTLLSDIDTTKDSIVEAKNHVAEAQLKEAELKEQVSKLQAELRNKEKEIQECERKLLYLQEQEKKSVSNTIGFTMEFLAMEKERSHMVEDQMKARQQLENMDAKWSSCLSNLRKTTMLLGVHLKQRL